MSTSDSSIQFQLKITVADEYKYLVKVLLFDSSSRIIPPNVQTKNDYLYQVKRGLYTVRVEMNAEIKDKVVRMNSDIEYFVASDLLLSNSKNIIEPPRQFSSALLGGQNEKTYGSSHEYYTNPAIHFSAKDTFFLSGYDQNISDSSLFIFMRFPTSKMYKELQIKWSKSFFQNFEILNEDGECIINFESRNGIEVNESDGWLAFNAKLPNGIYYLIYHGEESRQVPIYVFKNWHTQFFMTLGDVPLFGSIRIFVNRNRLFNPNAETNKYIDILLDKLQNNDYSVDKELIEIAANEKYDSPMLGLICSYVYFKSPETKSDYLFNIIIKNMQNVILKDNDESPDIRALNILSSNHFAKMNYKKTAVKGTPMLRIGFETIKNASIKDRNLIPKSSINDFISETLFYDSPFSTFKPIPFYKKLKSSLSLLTSTDEIANEIVLKENFLIRKGEQEFKDVGPKVDKYSVSIKDLLKPNVFNSIKNSNIDFNAENSWVKGSISDLINTNNNISINDISNQLNLSGNTITRIFDTWKKELKNKK